MSEKDESQCASSKHQITPMKTKAKASRSEYDEDVHTLSSSPVTPPRTKLSKSQASSPCPSSIAHAYYLDLCSQDLPDVIWDYSPMHKKDKNSDEKLLVIDDLLRYYHEQPEKPQIVVSQTARDLQLLEKWMEVKNVSPVSPRVGAKVIKKRIAKKRTCRLLREIHAMLNSADRDESSSASTTSTTNACQTQPSGERVIENHSTNCDDDDIWGSGTDNDDYILVKATQEVESRLMNYKSDCNDKMIEDTCTFKSVIPETMGTNNLFFKELNKNSKPSLTTSESNVCSKNSLFSDIDKVPSVPCASTFIRQNDDNKTFALENTWDNEFDDVLEPETFGLIPDDVLMGKIDESVNLVQTSVADSANNNGAIQNIGSLYHKIHKNSREDYKHKVFNSTSSVIENSAVLVNDTELCEEDPDDPFNDGLNEEDILAWADQTESLFSMKCTPEEIEHKRDIAMQKLQHRKKTLK